MEATIPLPTNTLHRRLLAPSENALDGFNLHLGVLEVIVPCLLQILLHFPQALWVADYRVQVSRQFVNFAHWP